MGSLKTLPSKTIKSLLFLLCSCAFHSHLFPLQGLRALYAQDRDEFVSLQKGNTLLSVDRLLYNEDEIPSKLMAKLASLAYKTRRVLRQEAVDRVMHIKIIQVETVPKLRHPSNLSFKSAAASHLNESGFTMEKDKGYNPNWVDFLNPDLTPAPTFPQCTYDSLFYTPELPLQLTVIYLTTLWEILPCKEADGTNPWIRAAAIELVKMVVLPAFDEQESNSLMGEFLRFYSSLYGSALGPYLSFVEEVVQQDQRELARIVKKIRELAAECGEPDDQVFKKLNATLAEEYSTNAKALNLLETISSRARRACADL